GFSESVTSAATDAVTPVNDGAATVTISGSPAEHQTLTAEFGDNDPDGAASGIHYQWKSDGSNVGSDQNTYQLQTSDVDHAITVAVSYSDGQGFSESVTSAATDAVTPVNDAPTLTTFAAPVATTSEDTQVQISLADLKAQGNEADVDGTVDAFVIKVVSTGSLKIGTSAGTATAFVAGSNDTVDATHNAYWTG